MLPLSKLPLTKDGRLGGFSMTNSASPNDISMASDSQLDDSSNLNVGSVDNPKLKLKSILEGKPESSVTVADNKHSSDQMISLVQVWSGLIILLV